MKERFPNKLPGRVCVYSTQNKIIIRDEDQQVKYIQVEIAVNILKC